MEKALAIIAGGGDLPHLLAQCCKLQKCPYEVIAMEGNADAAWVAEHPHSWHALGQIKTLIEFLEKKNITTLVFAGSIKRPSLKSLKMDSLAVEWLAKIGLKAFGDDGLLKGIIHRLEERGFTVIGAQEILNSLLTPVGVLGKICPSTEDWHDIKRGIEVARLLGQADIGQGVIVEEGVVLAVEAAEGTEGLLSRVKPLKKNSPAGVLVKTSKPRQEVRIDLPTIGPDTIKAAIEVGLKGVAVEKGKSLILHQEQCIQLADGEGLFLVGVE